MKRLKGKKKKRQKSKKAKRVKGKERKRLLWGKAPRSPLLSSPPLLHPHFSGQILLQNPHFDKWI